MGNDRTVYEVGYGGRAPEQLLAAVEGLDALLFDIRLSPRSRRPAWNRGRLAAAFGPRYAHVPELGHVNYREPEPGITLADAEGGVARIRSALRPVVPMCACRDFRECHRRTVAELLAAEGWRVAELEWDPAESATGGQLALPIAPPDPVKDGNAGALGTTEGGDD